MKRRLSVFLCALLGTMILLLSACGDGPGASLSPDSDLVVHFIDVGQADAALLLCEGETMLIDGGNASDSRLVAAYLTTHDVEHLDYMVATHAHEDHVGGLSGALNVCTVGTVYAPEKHYDSTAFSNFVKYVSDQDREITLPTPGETFSLGSATVQILGPLYEYSSTNDTSIVLKVTHGEVSFLFTGDAERTSELDILDAGYDLDATVLKVGHHGSNTSTTYPFLREIMPDYAVISVGEHNSYGHPSEEMLSRLRDAQVAVFRTDMQGHIIASSNGTTVSFETENRAIGLTNPTEADGSGQNGTRARADDYIGNLRSMKFHVPDCSSLPAEHNQIFFDSYDEAVDEGYSPCSICLSN